MRGLWWWGVLIWAGCSRPSAPPSAVSQAPLASATPATPATPAVGQRDAASAPPAFVVSAPAPAARPAPVSSAAAGQSEDLRGTVPGPPRSRQDYLFRTREWRKQRRSTAVAPAGERAKNSISQEPEWAPPTRDGRPRRLLYSGDPARAPAGLLNDPDVVCEFGMENGESQVRFYGP